MTVPQLRVEEQTITFRLLSEDKYWRSGIHLGGRSIDVELELEAAQTGRANWPKLEATLALLATRYDYFIAKAHTGLRYLARESALFDEVSLQSVNPYLDCITLDYPFSGMLRFQLHFNLDSGYRLDDSGDWIASFLGEHLVGIERVQG